MNKGWREKSVLGKGQALARLGFAGCFSLYFLCWDIRLIEASIGFLVSFQSLRLSCVRMRRSFPVMVEFFHGFDDQEIFLRNARLLARKLCVLSVAKALLLGFYYSLSFHFILHGSISIAILLIVVAVCRTFVLLLHSGDQWRFIEAMETLLIAFLPLWFRLYVVMGACKFSFF